MSTALQECRHKNILLPYSCTQMCSLIPWPIPQCCMLLFHDCNNNNYWRACEWGNTRMNNIIYVCCTTKTQTSLHMHKVHVHAHHMHIEVRSNSYTMWYSNIIYPPCIHSLQWGGYFSQPGHDEQNLSVTGTPSRELFESKTPEAFEEHLQVPSLQVYKHNKHSTLMECFIASNALIDLMPLHAWHTNQLIAIEYWAIENKYVIL